MASGQSIINTYIETYDGTDPADSANSRRRTQLRNLLRQMYPFIWNFREWAWTYTSKDVTFNAGGGTAALPTNPDFQNFGRHGGLFDTANKQRYRERSIHLINRLRYETSSTNLYVFAVEGTNLALPYSVSSNLTLKAVYRRIADTVNDDATALLIPDRYATTVMIPGLAMLGQKGKQDPRPDWGQILKDGLAQMCGQENPMMTEAVVLPLAIPGAW